MEAVVQVVDVELELFLFCLPLGAVERKTRLFGRDELRDEDLAEVI